MIFTFSIRDFGHPKFLKSQFGHPVMKILAKSLPRGEAIGPGAQAGQAYVAQDIAV